MYQDTPSCVLAGPLCTGDGCSRMGLAVPQARWSRIGPSWHRRHPAIPWMDLAVPGMGLAGMGCTSSCITSSSPLHKDTLCSAPAQHRACTGPPGGFIGINVTELCTAWEGDSHAGDMLSWGHHTCPVPVLAPMGTGSTLGLSSVVVLEGAAAALTTITRAWSGCREPGEERGTYGDSEGLKGWCQVWHSGDTTGSWGLGGLQLSSPLSQLPPSHLHHPSLP